MLAMCLHALYIFTCGHAIFQSSPLLQCPDAAIARESENGKSCMPRAHPYKSHYVHHLCLSCYSGKATLEQDIDAYRSQREERMRQILPGGDTVLGIRPVEWRWRVAIHGGGGKGDKALAPLRLAELWFSDTRSHRNSNASSSKSNNITTGKRKKGMMSWLSGRGDATGAEVARRPQAWRLGSSRPHAGKASF